MSSSGSFSPRFLNEMSSLILSGSVPGASSLLMSPTTSPSISKVGSEYTAVSVPAVGNSSTDGVKRCAYAEMARNKPFGVKG